MRLLDFFEKSVHPVIVHDGFCIFRVNQLALDLFGYQTKREFLTAGLAGIIAPDSRALSGERAQRLRRRPDVNLPDARLNFVRRDGSRFTALVHTHTLAWAFQEATDMSELCAQLKTEIVFYSWVEGIQELANE